MGHLSLAFPLKYLEVQLPAAPDQEFEFNFKPILRTPESDLIKA